MRLRPLLAALFFSLVNVPTLARSQAIFDTSNTPNTAAPQDFDYGNFSFSLADMGPIQDSGSTNYPGLGQVSWTPGTRPEDLFTVGMLNEFGFQNLSIDQISATTGQPLSQASLSSFPLLQRLSVSQLVQAIPGLGQTPVNQVPPIAALAQQQGLSVLNNSVGEIASQLPGPIGQLGAQLANFGISQIPGLSSTSLNQLPGISTAKISDIPGLDQFPLFDPLSILDWFVPFDIDFGMSACNMGGDCHERNIDNTASGNLKDMSISCTGADQSCAHIEVRRNGLNPTKKSRWISKEQKVPGGSGLGSAICSEEPTGRFPLGPNPKVVLEKIQEKPGKIEFALYFSVHVGLDDSDSAHCFGPFPMPFFGSAKEGQWILFGPDTVPKHSPFASIGQQSGFSPECPQSPSAQGPPDTSYGHKAYSEANQSDLVPVPTNASLNSPEALQKDAATAFEKMRQAAAADGIDLNVVSGFRSVATQQQLWDNQVAKQGSPEAAAKISAPPGYSEHATGYALDIGYGNTANLTAGFENTPAYAWLSRNATKYGFVQSFTRTSTIGADNEPWHWRFEGTLQAKTTFNPAPTVQQQTSSTGETYKGVSLNSLKSAISNAESRGTGGYQAIGIYIPNDGAGNHGRALGKYQFMSYGPARALILQKPGGQDFLNQIDSPNANVAQLNALTDKFFTPPQQEALMNSQVKELIDIAQLQGLQGDELIRRVAEMHEGGSGAASGIDTLYSSSVLSDYKNGGGSVANAGVGNGCSGAVQSAPVVPVDCKGNVSSFIRPTSGPITDDYGYSEWRHRMHEGIDMAPPYGTPIMAANCGVVTYNGSYGTYGNSIRIKHPGGGETWYAHMAQPSMLPVGTPVKKGQVIGLVGSTGHSTGPHLHFEWHPNGWRNPADPKVLGIF